MSEICLTQEIFLLFNGNKSVTNSKCYGSVPDLIVHKIEIGAKKKKILVSGNPTDPTFFGAYCQFVFGLRIFPFFRLFLMIILLFLYKKFYPKKKIINNFAYLPTLKNIEMFLETRHLFFWPRPVGNISCWLLLMRGLLEGGFSCFTTL